MDERLHDMTSDMMLLDVSPVKTIKKDTTDI
jgi:hypothetical protein